MVTVSKPEVACLGGDIQAHTSSELMPVDGQDPPGPDHAIMY